MKRLRLAPVLLPAILFFAVTPRLCAEAQLLPHWVVNGTVDAVAVSNDTIYLGGSFNYVGPPTGGAAALRAFNGEVDTSYPRTTFPRVTGEVYALAPDPSGGWYFGGRCSDCYNNCTSPSFNVVHILPDNRLDPSFNVYPDGNINSLELSGGVLYVGGCFTTIGGQARNRIAALDASTGNVLAWNPGANGCVYTLAVSGSTLYAAGSFTTIGGQPRRYLAALDASTGLATAWNPDPNSEVAALDVSGSTLYAGGGFTTIGGQSRRYLAALDASTGLATAWNPDPNENVDAFGVSGSTLYAAGDFTTIGGQARRYLAALDTATGAATSWNPDPWSSGYPFGANIEDLVVGGGTVYIGGWFRSFGGENRPCLAAVDAVTGLSRSLFRRVSASPVFALALSSDLRTLFVGGGFTSAGGLPRRNLAALHAATGAAADWDPQADGRVRALAVSGSTVYAGGEFIQVEGQARNHLAAMNAQTGSLLSWNPDAGNTVNAIAVNAGGTAVYVGGGFTSIGGQARNRFAAINASDGTVQDLVNNPDVDGDILTLLYSGGRIFTGGAFHTVSGQARNYLASVDAQTGAVDPWDPAADGSIRALALGNGVIYAGGTFTGMGGQSRNRLAALDPVTGLATSWNAWPVPGTINALAVSGNNIYVGGYNGGGSTIINGGMTLVTWGCTYAFLGAFDSQNGTQREWHPDPGYYQYSFISYADCFGDGFINALAASNGVVYAGGDFTETTGLIVDGYAAMTGDTWFAAVAETPTPVTPEPGRIISYPNPFRTGQGAQVTFRFEPCPKASLDIYDRALNKVRSLPDADIHAGNGTASWDGKDDKDEAVPSGLYFAVLDADGKKIKSKFTVLR